jgi:hypothetical protein
MTIFKLTGRHGAATGTKMRRKLRYLVAVLAAIALGGCVSIEAPTEPIVINLNINIRQEVVYRLVKDAEDLIAEEADIF